METIVIIVLIVLFRIIPETLFFVFFIINIKEIKEKRNILFILIALNYFILILMNNYKIINYIVFTILYYIILKLIYKNKTNVVDIFFIIYSQIYLSLTSFLCFCFVNENFSNYYILLVVSRLLLLIPFIFNKKILKFYKNYCKFWNRNDVAKKPIKSITLRNISLVILNIFIYINYLVFTYINSIVR